MNLKLCINIQKKEVQRPLKLLQRVFQNFQTIFRLARPTVFRFSNVTEFSLKKLITHNLRENVAIQIQLLGERGGSDVQHRKEKKRVTICHIGLGHWVQTYLSKVTPSPYKLRHMKKELFLV